MIPIYKCHCSKLHEIMGGNNKPTEKQLAELERLQNKDKLTDIQRNTLAELIAKRDAKPQLLAGAKTHCEQWLKEQLYDRKKYFSNDYTRKGNEVENDGITMIGRVMGYGEVFKNETQYENEYLIGTPDLVLRDVVEDHKASFDQSTFPLFDLELPDPKYFSQGQGYMALTGRHKFGVCYTLQNTPYDIIEKEAYYRSKAAGFDEIDMEILDQTVRNMTYNDVPEYLKFRRFEFEYDPKYIESAYAQVRLCREYIAELVARVEIIKGEFKLPVKDESWRNLPRASKNTLL